MSRAAPIRLRTLAFGDLDAGLWGFALGSLEDPQVSGLIGTIDGGATSPLSLSVETAGTGDPMRVTAQGTALTFTPAEGSPAVLSSADGAEALVELGSVQGTVRLGGIELDVDCLGQRGTRVLDLGLGELESLREVMAWFGPGDALALTSLRARRAKGHDRDRATTVLLEDGSPLPVQEPRLSTTYALDGAPARASLEMWLEEPEPVQGDDSEELTAQHFPRRAAGERVGPATRLGAAGLHVHAEPFRWHMRGLEGAGVYALARPL